MNVKIDSPEDRYRKMRLEELIEDWNDMEPDNKFEVSYRGNYVAEGLSLPLVQDVVEHFNGNNIHIIAYEY
jgi:hypothetical protein